jgi:hypothetical protein
MKKNKTILFYQHFGKNTEVRGAHFKSFDFFNHINSFDGYDAIIAFDRTSEWNSTLPWFNLFETMPTLDNVISNPDILFLNSGKDWIKYSQNAKINPNTPIISPVNHFRALNENHPSFKFLSHNAIRLCPSPELFMAVKNHPLTSGKTIYLPNGVYINENVSKLKNDKKIDLLIVGNKNPVLAQQIYSSFKHSSLNLVLLDKWMPKEGFQQMLAESKISVHLPKLVEAHYIPAIEAMMLNSLVVMPDCIGNRTYAKHLNTCYLSDYNLESLVHSIQSALEMQPEITDTIILNAQIESKAYSMNQEKSGLLNILNMLN